MGWENWGFRITFAVHLATALDDTRLAVLRLARGGSRVVERTIAREVLLRIHGRGVAVGDRHILHEHGEGVVSTRRAVESAVARSCRIEGVRHGRSGRSHGRRGSSRRLLRLRSGRSKGRSAGLEGRGDGRITGRLTAISRRGITRELPVMATRHDAGRDAAKASIVIMEMLLGVVVRIDTQANRTVGLDSRHVIGRVGLVQLGRRGQDMGGRRRNDRRCRRVRCSRGGLRVELHAVHRMADAGRAVAANGAGLRGRTNRSRTVGLGRADGRHTLLVAMFVNVVPAV